MRKWIKISLLLSGFLIIAAISYFIGGTIGFGEGYVAHSRNFAPGDAFDRIVALEAINKGDIKYASEVLEMELDGDLLKYWATKDINKSPFSFSVLNIDDSNSILLKKIAKYRISHPSQSKNKDARKIVDDLVKNIDSGKK